jgi:hypothetical protein
MHDLDTDNAGQHIQYQEFKTEIYVLFVSALGIALKKVTLWAGYVADEQRAKPLEVKGQSCDQH